MNYNNRNLIMESSEFQAQCKIALADWLNYWATNGTSSIEDEELRNKTDLFIKFAVQNLENYARSIRVLVIGELNLTQSESITDEQVQTAVAHVLSTALDYLI